MRPDTTEDGQYPGALSARRYADKYPWADTEAIETFFALAKTFNIVLTTLARYPMPGGAGLSRAQHTFLTALYVAEDNSLALSEIAREMNVTPTYVTKLSDALEAEGLVERNASRSDRRVTYARLTLDGLARCGELVPAFLRFIAEIGNDLSAPEKVELRRLLNAYTSRAGAMMTAPQQTD
ncbi:MAG: MarR family transcriptional regulator [Dehalococcoidia bacterium]|nr:MarR family transcriptional regulator [Dehalococcoidia bacterium]